MREKNWKKYLLTTFGTAVLLAAAVLGFPAVSVHAESGSVYSCTINRCYSHPVTGEIEDSGGEASYATGQGMVEGAVYASGLMEVTDSGNYYLTIRMSLIDYTSNQSFSVQNVGDSGWAGTGIAVTGNGSDSNGTTSDICMQVPSENCIVRVSMYVTPMGRDVTFYLYPSDYSEGNSVGMNPAFVTEEAASTEESGSSEAVSNSTLNTESSADTETASDEETSSDEEAAGTTQDQENDGTDSTEATENSADQSDAAATQAAAAQSTAKNGSAENTSTGNTSTESASGGNADAMNSGNTVAAAASAQAEAAKNSDESDTDKELNSAQGLNLSTAEEDSTTSTEKKTDGESSSVKINTVFAIALAVTGSGLVLILVTALIIWYFRKNWRRWGGEDDDDDEY